MLKEHFPLRILANLSHFFLSPALILKGGDMEHDFETFDKLHLLIAELIC